MREKVANAGNAVRGKRSVGGAKPASGVGKTRGDTNGAVFPLYMALFAAGRGHFAQAMCGGASGEARLCKKRAISATSLITKT